MSAKSKMRLLDPEPRRELKALQDRYPIHTTAEDFLQAALKPFPLYSTSELICAAVRRYVEAARSGVDANMTPVPWRNRDPLPQTASAGGRKSSTSGTLLQFPVLRYCPAVLTNHVDWGLKLTLSATISIVTPHTFMKD